MTAPKQNPPRTDGALAEKLIVAHAAGAAGAVWHVCCGTGQIARVMDPMWPAEQAVGVDRDAAMARRWDAAMPVAAVIADAERGGYWDGWPEPDVVVVDPYGGPARLLAPLLEAGVSPRMWVVTDGSGHTRMRARRPWLWEEMRMGDIDADAAHAQQRDLPVQLGAWMRAEPVDARRRGHMWVVALEPAAGY